MSRKYTAAAEALTLVVAVVFTWSLMMAAMGHALLIAALAPVLGLTSVQVSRALRPPTIPNSEVPATAAADKEDGSA